MPLKAGPQTSALLGSGQEFGHAKINMVLGLRWTLARRAGRAKRYLNEARRLALPFEPTPPGGSMRRWRGSANEPAYQRPSHCAG
jgi:hypothetical protein